jgi:dTDP-4-amino-4,6-dideoxygalactose transaminase
MPELPLINEILHSGKLAYGEYGKEFERLLGDFIGEKKVIVTNAFNMAIFVALSTIEVKHGDSVIASPMACLASSQPLLSMGLKVLWADIDPKTGTLCPDSVRHLARLGPKVIMHNHFCGYVGYVDEINSIGKEFGITVIDDCIEAFGSEYKGNKMGNLGTDITVFSFNPVRFPNTIDGGAIVFKDKNMFDRSLLLRDAGIDRKRFRDELGEINPECDIELIGYSATMGELSAYIGTQQMKNTNWILDSQRRNAKVWDQYFKNEKEVESLNNMDCFPNYWVYGILASNKRELIVRYRERDFYASGVHFNNNAYTVFNNRVELVGVTDFHNKFVALPSGWWINNIEKHFA